MKKLISKHALVAIAAGGMLFSSCGDHDMFNPNYKKNEYAANWETKFGKIDPAQDWSMATTVKATVNVAREGNFTVKVYSSNPADKTQQAYLLAKTSVTGGTPATLTFDAVKGLDNVYVALINEFGYGITKRVGIENGAAAADFYVTNGNRARTRTAAIGGFEKTSDFTNFTREEVLEILKALPEEEDAVDKNNNYEFESRGEFAIYPVYGCTAAADRVGYYYYDPKSESIDNRHEVVLADNIKQEEIQVIWSHGGTQNIDGGNSFFTDPNSNAFTWGMTGMRSKGFLINIPVGYRVGFWIENTEHYLGTKFYSNRVLNPECDYYSAVGKHSNGNYFFGLEDWLIKDSKGQGKNTDCNDIVFFVKNAGNNDLPDPVDPNEVPDDVEMSWILACEDLGSTDDYDFNDIVLEVMKNASNNAVEVRCLAAGGTLPAYIYYGGNLVDEAHAMLGGQTTQMINTNSFGGASEWYTVATGVSENMDINEIMGNISIRVQNEGQSEQYAVTISRPEKGEEATAPQMIILPGDWEWPSERKGIDDAYPLFMNWNSNASLNDWVSVNVSDKVVKR